jgi:hypothetical protein
MTVKELVAKLLELDQDAKVEIRCLYEDEMCCRVEFEDVISRVIEPDNPDHPIAYITND